MSQLCLGCMQENNGEQICPHCGFDRASEQTAPFLPLGTILQEQRYLVGKKIDNNAEGARYIGYDNFMHSPVVIHEFMPAGICGRAKGKVNVVIRGGYEETYKKLNDGFLEYYRTVARMRELSAIAPIYDIFSENGVSYTIEESFESIPFVEYIERRGGSIDWNTARPLFMPLLATLSSIHTAGIGHYGISPENIVVTSAGKLRLTGFAIKNIRETGGCFEPELFDGCAAIEQYSSGAKLDESTDIYGFTATLFYALTGRLPENSNVRKPDGKLPIPTAVFKKLPPHVVTALAGGLQVSQINRIQTFEKMRTQLSAAPTVKAIQTEATRSAIQTEVAQNYVPKKKTGVPGFVWALLSVLSCILILLVAGIIWMQDNPFNTWFATESEPSEVSEVSEVSNDDPNIIQIPDLKGRNFDELIARQDANSDYIIIKANEEMFSDKYAEGQIVSQTPEAGISAEKGAVIVVTVSKGLTTRELPAVSGQSVENAVRLLTNNGFIATGNYITSDTVEAGKVIGYENYNAGDFAPFGSKITINISTGPEKSLE